MKIVFDTNILLAGIFTRGVCEALLDECLGNEHHQIFTSNPILDEFLAIAREKFHVPPEKLRAAAMRLRENLIVVVPSHVPRDACRDPNDLSVLGTLTAACADCLVTGDKDLLILRRYQNRAIIPPRQCLELVTSGLDEADDPA